MNIFNFIYQAKYCLIIYFSTFTVINTYYVRETLEIVKECANFL